MSRIENTSKNFVFSLLATVVTAITSFVSRTVFIHTIGVDYLGANSLFTNVLSMLSLTELGISSAIGFSLYAPLARKDVPAIKALMQFYKRAYQIIALVIAILGLSLLPFLKYIIKDPGNIRHIPFIYIVFLYNTAVSYLFTYKTTLLVADQKSYVMTNMTAVINIITVAIQTTILLLFRNYFVYLILGAVINTVQWYFINRRIFSLYPYLKEKDAQPLDQETKQVITKNVKAMVFHKFGELCINQTDNIIISSFISITAVGIYNNYYMVIGIINRFAQSIFGAATASLGNLIATESCERRYEVFKRYNFLGFWVFGWTGICLLTLLNPFVELWLGKEFLIDDLTLGLVMLNYYLVGMRVTIGNVKMAAGLYSQDQWAPMAQAVINLVVSIWGAIHLGLAGVFLGTVVSSLAIPCWYRPVIVYKYAFQRSAREYFVYYALYFGVVVLNLFLVTAINRCFVDSIVTNAYFAFVLKMLVCAAVPNGVIVLLFHRTEEFRYLYTLIVSMLARFKK
jgi:O-antigen/teichoic acid export membrane protein